MRGCPKKTTALLLTLIVWVTQARSAEVGHLMEELIKPHSGVLEKRLGKRDPDALASADGRSKSPKEQICIVDGHPKLQSARKECPKTTPGASTPIE